MGDIKLGVIHFKSPELGCLHVPRHFAELWVSWTRGGRYRETATGPTPASLSHRPPGLATGFLRDHPAGILVDKQ